MKTINPKQIKQYVNRLFVPLIFGALLSLTSCSNENANLFDKKPVPADYVLSGSISILPNQTDFTMRSNEHGHSESYPASIYDLDSDGFVDVISGGSYHRLLAIKPGYRDYFSSWNPAQPELTADMDSTTYNLAQKIYELSEKLSYRIDSSRYAKWKQSAADYMTKN